MLLEGIRQFEDSSWHFEQDVSRVYVYGLSKTPDTLSAEVYYKDDRPKLILEFYYVGNGMFNESLSGS